MAGIGRRMTRLKVHRISRMGGRRRTLPPPTVGVERCESNLVGDSERFSYHLDELLPGLALLAILAGKGDRRSTLTRQNASVVPRIRRPGAKAIFFQMHPRALQISHGRDTPHGSRRCKSSKPR